MHNLFKNLKVLDLSTVLAGPSVATFFAELGAEVLKVEPPEMGDVTRSWKLPSEDPDDHISSYFSSVNFKKKYLTLDLLNEKDHSILMQHQISISDFSGPIEMLQSHINLLGDIYIDLVKKQALRMHLCFSCNVLFFL